MVIEFGQGRVQVVRLCSTMAGASAEKLEASAREASQFGF